MERHSIVMTNKDLLGVLAGFSYQLPSILLDGTPLPSKDILMLRKKSRLFPWRTLYHNLQLTLSYSQQEVPDPAEYLHTLLKEYGLLEYQHCFPFLLSPALQYRASLLQALLQKPAVICFYFTFDHLDLEEQSRILHSMRHFLQKEKQPAILITRQIAAALHFADQILLPGTDTARLTVERDLHKDYNHIHSLLSSSQ